MATDKSIPVGDSYRGLGIQDPRWLAAGVVRADGAFTEASPRPGVPVAVRNSGAVLETSGAMPNTVGLIPQLTLTANKGGMPGVQDARFTWASNYNNTSGYQTEYGWDAPNAISRHERIPVTVAGSIYVEGCVRLQDNSVLVGYTQVNGDVVTAHVLRKTFDTAGYAATAAVRWNWQASIQIDTSNSATDYEIIPGTLCFLQLPEGRIHAYWIAENDVVATNKFFQCWTALSDDNGLTWAISGKPVWRQTIRADDVVGLGGRGFEMTRLRVAYSNGQVLMIAAGTAHETTFDCANTLWQYASSDLGSLFDRIDITHAGLSAYSSDGGYIVGNINASAGHGGGFPDITVARDGAFVVSYIRVASVGNVVPFFYKLHVKRLGTAYSSWLDVTETYVTPAESLGTVSADILTGTNTAISTDETGAIVVSWQRDIDGAGGAVGTSASALSIDNGLTWATHMSIYSDLNADEVARSFPWWKSGDVAFYPAGYSSTFQCGRLLVFSLFNTGTAQANSVNRTRLFELDLGGYTTATRPWKRPEEEDQNLVMWECNWLPMERFTDTTGWAVTLVGAATEVLTSGDYTTLTAAGGQSITLENTSLGAVVSGEHRTLLLPEWRQTSGSSRVEVLIGDGANKIELYFTYSMTTLSIYDVGALAVIGTVDSASAGGWHQILVNPRQHGRTMPCTAARSRPTRCPSTAATACACGQ